MTRNLRRSNIDTREVHATTVVIGIDPGTMVTGYGIVARTDGALRLLDCGTIRNAAGTSLPARLHNIYKNLGALIMTFHPDVMAIESAFFGKNAQSALKLGHARGVSLLAAMEQSIPAAEYTPREVKKAVVGNGAATKHQVRYMVKSILKFTTTRMALDSSDAIALALCHLQRSSLTTGAHQDWKSYIAAHPERVRR
jgi:crossover junction endodeoxyribonuclease RuvC